MLVLVHTLKHSVPPFLQGPSFAPAGRAQADGCAYSASSLLMHSAQYLSVHKYLCTLKYCAECIRSEEALYAHPSAWALPAGAKLGPCRNGGTECLSVCTSTSIRPQTERRLSTVHAVVLG